MKSPRNRGEFSFEEQIEAGAGSSAPACAPRSSKFCAVMFSPELSVSSCAAEVRLAAFCAAVERQERLAVPLVPPQALHTTTFANHSQT